MADNELTLPYPEITKIPDTEPDAVPSLWNNTYEEIDANFAAIKQGIDNGLGNITYEDINEIGDIIIVEKTSESDVTYKDA